MSSEFLERNKRKSALALLLLMLGGRARYVVALFVAVMVSVPFLVSGDRLNALMSFPAVAAVLRTVGLGGTAAPDMLAAAAMHKDGGGAKASFWERYLRAANAPLPPAGATSTMAMVRVGGDDYGPAVLKDGGKPAGPNKVKGAVNAEERANGDDGAGVNLAGLTGGYGDLMGEGLGSRQLGTVPYYNRTLLGGPGGAVDKRDGVYNQIMVKAGEGVPVPGAPEKMKSKMGRVSAFSFKSFSRKNRKSQALGGLRSNRKPLTQMKQATAMATIALFDGVSTEHTATYSGAVYDGNSVDLDLMMEGDAVVPSMPSFAFANGVIGAINTSMAQSLACANDYTNMQKITDQMQPYFDIMSEFGDKPPNFCDSKEKRDRWNSAFQGEGLISQCPRANDAMDRLIAKGCPMEKQGKFDCSSFSDRVIDCGSLGCPLKCALKWLIIAIAAAIVIIACFNPFSLIAAAAIAAVIAAAGLVAGLLIWAALSIK